MVMCLQTKKMSERVLSVSASGCRACLGYVWPELGQLPPQEPFSPTAAWAFLVRG